MSSSTGCCRQTGSQIISQLKTIKKKSDFYIFVWKSYKPFPNNIANRFVADG